MKDAKEYKQKTNHNAAVIAALRKLAEVFKRRYILHLNFIKKLIPNHNTI
jgi:hypothetical protein